MAGFSHAGAVAREGFQTFRRDLLEAWETAGRGPAGFSAMGAAYVRFARANPSHYRLMFGGFRDLCQRDELASIRRGTTEGSGGDRSYRPTSCISTSRTSAGGMLPILRRRSWKSLSVKAAPRA